MSPCVSVGERSVEYFLPLMRSSFDGVAVGAICRDSRDRLIGFNCYVVKLEHRPRTPHHQSPATGPGPFASSVSSALLANEREGESLSDT